MGAMLTCSELAAGYERTTVVRGFELTVDPGAVVALLGPNGAGKTTLLLTMAGLLPAKGGSVSVDGRSLPSGRPRAASSSGLVLVPDSRALFTQMTVAQNLKVAAGRRGLPAQEMYAIFPRLRERKNQNAGTLSGGEQQMLALARALVQRPKVLLIDEMSMGLAPVIVESLLPVVRDVARESGVAIVLVEQHVRLALEFADKAVVLVHGSVAMEASAAELLADPSRIESAYLGHEVPAPA